MKSSEYYGLVAVMYITPHFPWWGGVIGFVVFSVLALICRYLGKN